MSVLHTVEWVESLSVTHDDQSANNTGRGPETFWAPLAEPNRPLTRSKTDPVCQQDGCKYSLPSKRDKSNLVWAERSSTLPPCLPGRDRQTLLQMMEMNYIQWSGWRVWASLIWPEQEYTERDPETFWASPAEPNRPLAKDKTDSVYKQNGRKYSLPKTIDKSNVWWVERS